MGRVNDWCSSGWMADGSTAHAVVHRDNTLGGNTLLRVGKSH